MFQVLLIVHLLLCLFLVIAILLQRSEGGGALGIGGGPSSIMSGRSATNFMTRATSVLAAAFFVTSISLSLIAKMDEKPQGSLMRDSNTTADGLPISGIDLNPAVNAATNSAPHDLSIPASGLATSAQPAPAAPASAPAADANTNILGNSAQ